MNSGIYEIRNIINNKSYIGSSKNLNHRRSTHFYDLRNSKHKNPHLQRSFNKHGENNFIFSILEECRLEDLINREQYYLNTYRPEYNILKIAGSSTGIKRPDQSIRMKEFNKNRTISDKTKLRTSNTLKNIGHKPTKECTEKSMKVLRKRVIQYDLENNYIKEFESLSEACRELNMSSGNLSKACKQDRSLKGFKWKYKN